MIFWTWLRTLVRGKRSPLRRKPARIRLTLETLEDRVVPSTTGVDSAYDAWRSQTYALDQIDLAVANQPTIAIDHTASVAASPTIQGEGFENAIGLPNVNANYSSYKGQGYTVAIIDTGIDYNNAALGGGWGRRVVGGWDFVNNDSDPMDDNGHGTHVAGIIGSSDATYTGIAPNVNFVALKVLGSDGSGSFGYVEDALNWVIANRTKYNIVSINMSLGTGNYNSNPYTFLENEFSTLKSQGVFIAVAAGNSFYSVNSQVGLGYPAVSPLTVSVGATWDGNFGAVSWASGARDYTTDVDRIASFSQRSSALSIMAPGALITSTYLNNTFQSMAGTSMATPVVAGSAVLIHQALDSAGLSSTANQDTILGIMQSTGKTVLDGDDENDNVTNTGLAFKRLDLYASLQSIRPSAPSNHAPTLASIIDQTLNKTTPSSFTLFGNDADGDALTYGARVVTASAQAVQLQQSLGLRLYDSTHGYFTNSYGMNEKWIYSNNGTWYELLSNGEVHKWTGTAPVQQSVLPLVATLDPSYYLDPSLLWNAPNRTTAPPLTASVSGATLMLTAGAGYQGGAIVEASVSDGKATTKQYFMVQTTGNGAPTIAPIPDQTVAANHDSLITLAAADPDGDALTFSARFVAASQQAVQLQQSLGLRLYDDSHGYFTNCYGLNEKWIYSNSGKWYAVFANGELRAWSGTTPVTMANLALVATLDGSYYADPSLLWNAANRTSAPPVTLTFYANQLLIHPASGYLGSSMVEVTVSDGQNNTKAFFNLTVRDTAPVLSAVANQAMVKNQAPLTVNLSASDADGDALTYSARIVTASAQAVQLQQSLGLKLYDNTHGYFTNSYGMNEKWIYSTSGKWYALLPNGQVLYWSGAAPVAQSQLTVVATLDPSYYLDPALLWNAPNRTTAAPLGLSVSSNRLTISTPTGYVGGAVVEATVSDGQLTSKQYFTVTVS